MYTILTLSKSSVLRTMVGSSVSGTLRLDPDRGLFPPTLSGEDCFFGKFGLLVIAPFFRFFKAGILLASDFFLKLQWKSAVNSVFTSNHITQKWNSTLIYKLKKNQGVFVKHYSMPPAATKSKKLFLASRSKSRSQGHWPWCHLKEHH